MDTDYLWMMILPWVQNEYKKRGASLYRGGDEKYRKLYIHYIYHTFATESVNCISSRKEFPIGFGAHSESGIYDKNTCIPLFLLVLL